MAKKVFMEKKRLFTGKVNLELKKRIMKCLIWSVVLYAAETWMLIQTDRRRLEAFEMEKDRKDPLLSSDSYRKNQSHFRQGYVQYSAE